MSKWTDCHRQPVHPIHNESMTVWNTTRYNNAHIIYLLNFLSVVADMRRPIAHRSITERCVGWQRAVRNDFSVAAAAYLEMLAWVSPAWSCNARSAYIDISARRRLNDRRLPHLPTCLHELLLPVWHNVYQLSARSLPEDTWDQYCITYGVVWDIYHPRCTQTDDWPSGFCCWSPMNISQLNQSWLTRTYDDVM